jgi:hypothetical protein
LGVGNTLMSTPRKQAEGKSRKQALRCLKRHLAWRVWQLLRPPPQFKTDARTTTPPSAPPSADHRSGLYHHGCPQRGDLINRAGLAWLAALASPACAREQVATALAMIDALERQLAPLDKELRSSPAASRAARR